jgi:hypothetical protein
MCGTTYLLSYPGLFLAAGRDFFKARIMKTAPSPVDLVTPFTTGGKSLGVVATCAPRPGAS